MANLDITIKRKNGAGYDVLYPTTIIAQVEGLQTALDGKVNTSALGAANGVATLDSNSKVTATQLPDFVTGGMKFVGALSIPGSPSSPLGLASLISGTVTSGYSVGTTLDGVTGLSYASDNYVTNNAGARYVGHYWIASVNMSIMDNSTSDSSAWGSAVFDDGVAPVLVGGLYADTVSVEAGDWIVITGYNSGTDLFTFRILSNTYGDATTAAKGAVQLSGSTSTATTGSNVITDGILNGLVTTTVGTANKLMAAAHNHDSAYLGISATAANATKWANARTITLNGDASGSVSIDGSTDVTLTVAVANDSHTHAFANLTSKPTTLSGYGITDAVAANTAITAATNTKITYDAKGLVTAGTTLAATDIPSLDAGKITTGTFAIGLIPTGTTSTTVSLGNHTHTFASLTSKPTTLSGYGITDAASTSDLTNRPEIYYNASANSDGDLVLDLDSDGAVA
jgi:hypothetical protein